MLTGLTFNCKVSYIHVAVKNLDKYKSRIEYLEFQTYSI
jgi:hypothetical protein